MHRRREEHTYAENDKHRMSGLYNDQEKRNG